MHPHAKDQISLSNLEKPVIMTMGGPIETKLTISSKASTMQPCCSTINPSSNAIASPAQFTCLYCFKKFASSNNLLAHIRKSHLQATGKPLLKNVYQCEQCAFSTTRRRVLQTHKRYCKEGQSVNVS